jgi:hypothetical protein
VGVYVARHPGTNPGLKISPKIKKDNGDRTMKVRIIIIMALSLTLICGCSKKDNNENSSTTQKETSKDFTIRNDILFDTHTNDFIFIKGKDITLDGNNAHMETDMNNDGVNEKFTIRLDHPNGTEVMYYGDKSAANLLDILINNPLEYSNAFDDYGNPKEDYYYQISCYDLDNDGIKEIILSVGDMSIDEVSLIYRLTDSTDPIMYVGAAGGQQSMYISPENHIYAPYGTVGLFNDYIYKDKRLYEAVEY